MKIKQITFIAYKTLIINNITPVSYTHLDVYKRQMNTLSAILWNPDIEIFSIFGISIRYYSVLFVTGLSLAYWVTVSYTHLDVYKRQHLLQLDRLIVEVKPTLYYDNPPLPAWHTPVSYTHLHL